MPLKPEYAEAAAAALAVACNGGEWDAHYTDKQKALWRRRLLAAFRDQKTYDLSVRI